MVGRHTFALYLVARSTNRYNVEGDHASRRILIPVFVILASMVHLYYTVCAQ